MNHRKLTVCSGNVPKPVISRHAWEDHIILKIGLIAICPVISGDAQLNLVKF
jgi:hypothetical protein